MVDTSVDETERSFWHDDPQDRAPMPEAIDTIKDLKQRLATVEAERDQWKIDAKQLQSTLCVVEEENTELRKLNNELRTERDHLRKTLTGRPSKELYEAHAQELKTERDRLKEDNGKMDSMYQDRLLDMESKINKAVSECDRLKAENERLLRCLADYPAGNQTEPDVKAALREVDGGKETY